MLSNLVIWGDEEKVKVGPNYIPKGPDLEEGRGESGSVCETGLCGAHPSVQCSGCLIDAECVSKFIFVSKAM